MNPVLAVAADRLQESALFQGVIHLLLCCEVLSHLLAAFRAGHLEPLQPGELPQGLDEQADGIGIFLLLKEQWPQVLDEERKLCAFLLKGNDEQVQAPGKADLLADLWTGAAFGGEQGDHALGVTQPKRDPLRQGDGRGLIIESDIAFQAHPPESGGEAQGFIFVCVTVGDVNSGDHPSIISTLSKKG